MPTTIRPGDTLDERYRLDDLLSESGSGRFWRAHDRVLQRHVALHVIAADDERAPSLLDAARRSATVINPRILRVLDAQMRSDVGFVVNEFTYGTSLDIALANNGPMVPRRAAWLVAEVADSVAAAHAHGVHHGRLVPENVLIDQTGSVRIIGFCVDAALHGLPAGDEASDVHDLAGLLYAALTGKWAGETTSSVPAAPHDGTRSLRPRQVRAGVPRPLDDLVDRLLNPDTSRLRDRDLAHADAVASFLSDFVGDPSGIAESLAAAHPARAQDLVVLEQVPEIRVRPQAAMSAPTPSAPPRAETAVPPASPAPAVATDVVGPVQEATAEPSGYYTDGRPEPTIQVPRLDLDRRLRSAAAALAGETAPVAPSPLEVADDLAELKDLGDLGDLDALETLESADAEARAQHLAEPFVDPLAPVVVPDAVTDPEHDLDDEPDAGIDAVLDEGSAPWPDGGWSEDELPESDASMQPADPTGTSDDEDEDEEDLFSVLDDESVDDPTPRALLLDRFTTQDEDPRGTRQRPDADVPAPRSRDRARRATRAARTTQSEDPIGSRIDYFTSLYAGEDPLGIGIPAGPSERTQQWEGEAWSGEEADWSAAATGEGPSDLGDVVSSDVDRLDDRAPAAADRDLRGSIGTRDLDQDHEDDQAASDAAFDDDYDVDDDYDDDAFVRGDTAERIPAVRPTSRPLFAPEPEPGDPPRRSRRRDLAQRNDNAPWDREDDIRAKLRDHADDEDGDGTDDSGPVAGRGWLRLAGLIALAVVLIVGVAVAYNRGGDSAGSGDPVVAEPKPVAAGGPVIGTLTASVFDPTGNPGGASQGVESAVDADLATSWKTGTFTEQFSPDSARAGLGLLIDTGSDQPISQIDLTLDGEPSHVVLYVLDEIPQSLTTTQSAADFDAAATQSVSLRGGTTGRYVVVWLTKIPQVDSNYEGGIADVTLHS